jgi:Mlc titration factor MtfA (ptsG expression regulator)
VVARALARLGAWREQRALERRAIPDDLWQLTLARLPFIARLDEDDLAELRRLCSLFLDRKEFHGVGGLEVTDDMALVIAAQACLPVLRLGLHYYDGFVTASSSTRTASSRRAAWSTRTASSTSTRTSSAARRWRTAR